MDQSLEGPSPSRRTVLKAAALGAVALQVGGCKQNLMPAAAGGRKAALQLLTEAEAALLEALGETLVPGAAAAGIVPYVDANLARAPEDCLLTVRYLDVLPPFTAFYKAGLAALEDAAVRMFGKPFGKADGAERKSLVALLLPAEVAGWKGPPSPLFYLAVRSDAADLVYGTRAAFERMHIPYMAHLEPPADW